MTAFADSSALVKLYADEDGSDAVRGESALVVCALARVEVPAALWRKHRTGHLEAEEAAALASDFEVDYRGSESDAPRFAVVRVTAQLLDLAATFPALNDLRSQDAVQLAAALSTVATDPDVTGFLCFDARLRAAAAAHGLRPRP